MRSKTVSESPSGAPRERKNSGTYYITRSYSDLVAMGLHDIGEPLSALRMSLHALDRRLSTHAPDSPERELGRRMSAMVDRLAQLVSHLIEVVQSGDHDASAFGMTDMAAIAREVCSTLVPHGTQSSTRISLHAPDPVWGHWNELQIWQILSNLVCNAAHHAKGSSIVVCVWAEDGEGFASVEDSGPGVPDSQRAKIFSKGWRGGASGNYGLGLWIAQQLARECGGDLTLCRKVGPGAKFVARLPCHVARERQHTNE